MPISFRDSKDKLTGQILDLLWRQWSTLGVAGQARPVNEGITDPESLLLATTRFCRQDPRLLDEVIDWLTSHGQRINLQRLRRLHQQWPVVAEPRVLAAIGGILGQRAALRKWQIVDVGQQPAGEPEPLFTGPGGTALPVFQPASSEFLRHGLLRGPWQPRGMSQSPDPRKAANLLCTLRALFGVNARAEILAWLLTHESGHPAAIARDTGYFSKSVQFTLNEMEDSGHVRSRRDGREKFFWIKPDDWKFLVTWDHPTGFPSWIDWMPLFSAVTTVVDTFGRSDLAESAESVQAILLRKALDHAMPAFARAGLAERMSASRGLTGKQLVHSFMRDAEMLGHALESGLS